MKDIFAKALTEAAEQDANVMLLTGDLGFGVFDEFQKKFSSQFINTGLSEPHMAGMAAGLAKEGKVVFVYSIGNFPTLRALEQIRIDIAYHDVPVIVVCIGGGFSYGQLGMSHHALEDLSTMRAMPNMRVYAPADDWEAEEIMRAILRKPHPAYLRLDKSSAGNTRQKDEVFGLGAIRTVRTGNDVTLITTGSILAEALAAADLLAKEGIEARVLSAHSLKPFDATTLLTAVRETPRVISIEEHVIQGGLGGVIAETCLANGVYPERFKSLGLDNEFPTVVGTQQYLRKHYGIDAGAIATHTKQLLER